jgi:hypothetical protein
VLAGAGLSWLPISCAKALPSVKPNMAIETARAANVRPTMAELCHRARRVGQATRRSCSKTSRRYSMIRGRLRRGA